MSLRLVRRSWRLLAEAAAKAKKQPARHRRQHTSRMSFEALEPRQLLAANPIARADDFGNDFASASPITLVAGAATRNARIDSSTDTDFFRFNVATAGRLTVADARTGGTMVPAFNVYDAAHNFLGSSYIFNTSSSRHELNVAAGDYFLQAYSGTPATGTYRLSINVTADDHSDMTTFATTLNPNTMDWRTGVIDRAADVDYFKFTAVATGRMTVYLTQNAGSSVNPILTATGPNTNLTNDNYGGGVNSYMTFDVLAGQTYNLKVASVGGTTGAYTVSAVFNTDDYADSPGDAQTLPLMYPGVYNLPLATINRTDDPDVFRFVAPATGHVVVTMSEIDAGLSPVLSFSAPANISNTATTSVLDANVTAGTAYFVTATGGGTTGRYSLNFNTLIDEHGNSLAAASYLNASSGAASGAGAINWAYDEDWFYVITPTTAQMTLTMTSGGSVDSSVQVYSPGGVLLAAGVDSGNDSVATFQSAPAGLFFIRAAGQGGTSGAYNLQLSSTTDDVGNSFAAARVAPLDNNGQGFLTGNINWNGDQDVFRIVPNGTGYLTATEVVAGTDTNLLLYDSGGNLLTQTRTDTHLEEWQVDAGTVYYAVVQQSGGALGNYWWSLQGPADDFDSTYGPLLPLAGSLASQVATINFAGDVDRFDVVATWDRGTNPRFVVTVDPINGSALDPRVEIYNAGTGLLVASNDDATPGLTLASRVQIGPGTAVVKNQRYAIYVNGVNNTVGQYLVQFRIDTDAAPGTPLPPDPPGPVSAFDILVNSPDLTGQGAYENVRIAAEQVWESIILGPDRSATADFTVNISITGIDGSGGVRMRGRPVPGWTNVPSTTATLPTVGEIQIDSADLTFLMNTANFDIFRSLMIREIAHCLGFGYRWGIISDGSGGRHDERADTVNGDFRHLFVGATAIAEYRTLFAIPATVTIPGVPLESPVVYTGSGLTAASWVYYFWEREGRPVDTYTPALPTSNILPGFVDEVMCGEDVLRSGTRPIGRVSRVTAAVFQDMGYTVNLNAAQGYTRPPVILPPTPF